jgi:predicted transglutaminase-like cysteine proteinase
MTKSNSLWILLFGIGLSLFPLPSAAGLRVQPPWDEQVFQQFGKEHGDAAGKRLKALYNLVLQSTDWPLAENLKRANEFLNLWKSVPDIENWGVQDYWASPMEFIAKFAGDSEDFAIAKMTLLELMGVPRKNLYLGYVRHKKTGVPLMILAWVSDDRSKTLILDQEEKSIKTAKERQDLQAIYLTDGKGHVIVINDQAGERSVLGEVSQVPLSKIEEITERTQQMRELYKEFNNGIPLFRLEPD